MYNINNNNKNKSSVKQHSETYGPQRSPEYITMADYFSFAITTIKTQFTGRCVSHKMLGYSHNC